MNTGRPRVFTIPPSAAFLPTLIEALCAGNLIPGFPERGDPLALADATLYLPTRRACRLARDVFLGALKTDAAILPRIRAIGDIDEDALVFAAAATGPAANQALELPPALGGLERRMLLAQLVMKWSRAPELRGAGGAPLVAYSPTTALTLADGLAHLIDDMTTRKVPWSGLDDLVEERFDAYWQLTLRFLKIAREEWPKILSERGVIEPAARRDTLIAAEAARLAVTNAPVVAAGSTGSMPATAAFLATVARLPRGAVVLPGLDTDLPPSAWETIGGSAEGAAAVGHPQFAMHGLLRHLGLARDGVEMLGAAAAHRREGIVSHALCPAAASECWQVRLPDEQIAGAFTGVTAVEVANSEEEALAIAVILRAAVEQPGKTAALVTPDRALARRVIAALARWDVAVDDSGGDRLGELPAGVLARLAAEATIGGLPPPSLLALLKHPLTRFGGRSGEGAALDVMERAILRGPRPRPGSAGLRQALTTLRGTQASLHDRDPRKHLSGRQLDLASALIERLAVALAPLENLGSEPRSFADLASRHRAVVAALTREGKESVAFAPDEGAALALAFDEIAASGGSFMVVPAEYPELFAAVIGDRVVRRPSAPGVRVRIFGLLEARLQSADLMVLGGLVEGTWPPDAQNDAWLSRPMRQELGLDLPERRIGLTAHDFAQVLGAHEVVLTRAAKVAGAPTLWSRFAQRLAAVAGAATWNEALARGAHYLTLARELDRPAKVVPIAVPVPCPPLAARPKRLSVTEIEDWLRDPYTIYARHVLRLRPLDPIDTPPGAADRGSAIHGAIGDFTKLWSGRIPPDPIGELTRLGREHFAPLEDFPEARAFWWPRFLRICRWFAGWEAERRSALDTIHAEVAGEIKIPVAGETFVLRGRADRIERRAGGGYVILDYKTGQPPSEKQVRCGFAPQLPLEAAILRYGAFAGVPAGGSVEQLIYVRLRGGEPAAEAKPIEFKEGSPDSQADKALRRLTAIVTRFNDPTQPYRSLLHPMWIWKTRYGDYDHLARVKEWSLTAGLNDMDPLP